MKRQLIASLAAIWVSLTCIANLANAALITTDFSELTGNQGTVDIQLTLGNAEVIEGFQVFFNESLFSNLTILNSPTGWDSLLLSEIQGPVIFDSYNGAGLSSGKASLSFTYLGQGAFQPLYVEFYNNDFAVTGSGTTTNVKHAVPESSSIALLLLGLVSIVAHRIRRTRATVSEVAA